MTLTWFEKLTLGLSGATALGIGASILIAPHAFYESYGITLGEDPSLLSELRAPAAGLTTLGAIMLAGLVRGAFSPFSILASLTVFLGFPAGRLIGVLVDGMPSAAILGALAFELAIAGLNLAAFRRRLRPAGGARNTSANIA